MSKRKSKSEQIDWLRDQLEGSQARVQQLVVERDRLRKQVQEHEEHVAQIRKIIGPAPLTFIGGGGAGGVTYTYPTVTQQ